MRALYPGLLGIACCGAFVLNSSAQSLGHGLVVGTEQHPRGSWAVQLPQHPGDVSALAELPDTPGTTLALLQASEGASQQGMVPSQNPPPPPSDKKTQGQQKEQRPVGTAAAEAPKVSGITAAQPAGVAIAPAKQRRVRTIVLRVGAIVGAGAALGTVIALTEATPSKPPGAH